MILQTKGSSASPYWKDYLLGKTPLDGLKSIINISATLSPMDVEVNADGKLKITIKRSLYLEGTAIIYPVHDGVVIEVTRGSDTAKVKVTDIGKYKKAISILKGSYKPMKKYNGIEIINNI